jgi:ribonuclease E
MSKEIYISSTPHETRLAIVEKDELTEIYYERENEYTLAGSIYNGRVTRVLPGMQSSFVDIGLERDAFLYITDFMEEAGDAADFDAAGGGEARAPRAERPRVEGEGRSEARGEGRSEGRGEGRGEVRGEGRGEGRREGRGRGRRDGRDGGERRPREAQAESRVSAPVESSVVEDEPRSFVPVDDEFIDVAPRESEGDEIGEGAPGADGSRRWRGRRGRRRGRGLASEPGADAAVASNVEADVVEAAPQQEVRAPRIVEGRDSERRPSGDREGRGDQGGGDQGGGERGPREGGRERGGRDRGGRGGRDRDRGGNRGGDRAAAPSAEQGGRDNRQDAIRERFAPRGGARPASSHDEVIDLSAAAAAPEVEPFILPGESLSKYRKGENGAANELAAGKTFGTPVTAKPSTEIAPLVGWDGGAVLPGETLRARGPRSDSRNEPRAEASNEPRGESRGEGRGGERGGSRRRGRDEQRRGGRDGNRDAAPRSEFSAAPTRMDPAEAVLPAVTSQHDVTESEYEPHYPVVTDLAPVEADEPVVEHEAEFEAAVGELQEPEMQETTTEYEPEENASASFRIDPAGQREFRQSSPVEEPVAEETHEPVVEHEFTTLQPTGELISEVEHTEIKHGDPAAPIEHEAVVQSVHLDEAKTVVVPVDLAGEFAPGDGQLEEEVMEDEESEPVALQASGFDDDTEEETLEGAADLGSMIRDMTIDDITRPEPVEVDEDEDEEFDDEEDFEEDELASNGEEDFEDDEVSGSEISESEEEEFAEASSFDENGDAPKAVIEGETAQREGGRRGRRDGRRGGRERGERGGGERSSERSSSDRSGSDRSGSDRSGSERSGGERSSGERSGGERSARDGRGMANSRPRGGGRDRGGRSMQTTNLPAISDLLKPGQEILVQIAKEPIAKKGARITSHIALPGRFLVFMPTVNHTGVSRKIESDHERRRLKEILLSEKGDAQGGFIVRTAAEGATEEELRSDLRFLLNLWADIKTRSESSKSPALIYHDLNLIERILRDQVTDNFSAIWVDTEAEYERVLRFLQRFQPNLIRRVKLYTKDTPLFEQFGITEEINKALRAKVWLKSGGSIVINQTEALVAIDINTGKYVGKTARLEDTIVKTNMDAIPEIVRQIRLRDLGGIIIIDFIDMDERKNRNKVLAALEEELKSDRAPSKVLQFNDFGLVAITRKRVKQSLERTLSTTCGICAGTGMVKSPVTVCNDIYIEMRKMHKLIEKGDIMLRVNPEVVKQLKTGGAKWLQEMEEMSGKTILVKSDPSLHPEQFDIH